MSYMLCAKCGHFNGVIGTAIYQCLCVPTKRYKPGDIVDVDGGVFPKTVPYVLQPRDPRGTVHPLDPAYDPPLYWPDPGWVSYKFKFVAAPPPPRGELLEKIRKIDEVQTIE